MDWLATAEQVLSLLVGLIGFIGTAVSTFFAIKATIEKNKTKTIYQKWKTIMAMADAAMKVAEASGKPGPEKKKMVMEMLLHESNSVGIDLSLFSQQVAEYIDQTIDFVKGMASKK
jgi:HD-like signal output (HDOD) protein